MNFPDNIDDWALAVVPVGSRITCTPPPTDTDQDLLVLVENQEDLQQFEDRLEVLDWESEGESYKENAAEFNSWRKEVDGTEFNIILTDNEKWFDTFLDATFSCKEKNLLTKEARIAEFEKFFGPKKKTVTFKPFDLGIMGMQANIAEIEAKIAATQAQHAAQQAQQNLWANAADQANAQGIHNYVYGNGLQGLQANAVIYDDMAPAEAVGVWWNKVNAW